MQKGGKGLILWSCPAEMDRYLEAVETFLLMGLVGDISKYLVPFTYLIFNSIFLGN